jgi:hypothetical protein
MFCAGVLLTLTGCADDSADGTEQRHTHELHLSIGTQQYEMTRAGDEPSLPTDFVLYNHAESLSPITQIQGYMTYLEDNNAWNYVPCTFNYTETIEYISEEIVNHKDTWTARVPLKTLTGDNSYYLYGFLPKERVGSVNITPYSNNYSKGAILTFTDLNAVTPDDICVIVGAKGYGKTPDYTNVPNDMPSRLGKFDYNPDKVGDNLFLLIDHLYAGLQFNMKLGEQYSQLRGIKVKSIKLMPNNGNNDVIETVNVTVRLVANTTGKNPLTPEYVGSENIGGYVVYQNSKTGKNPEPAVLYDGEGKELTTTEEKFLACFCPSTNTKFMLETKYNVYDRQGNLIREDETARNSIELKRNLQSGQIHIVDITVQPTYLYVLSDPDLDNPTFNVN